MIPRFPQFKTIEAKDRKAIEAYTKKFPPYSDFNFTSLWSWDTEKSMKISTLNGNLVVCFSDYLSGKPFYSFLGEYKKEATIDTLLALSKKEKLVAALSLIPERSVQGLDPKKYRVSEDRHHFDYIASIPHLLPHDGSLRKLSSRRKLIQKFKAQAEFVLTPLTLTDPKTQKEILSVFMKWENQLSSSKHTTAHLGRALEKLFSLDSFGRCLSFGVYLRGELIGYSIVEVVGNGYAIGHFQQGNLKAFSGIYALLMHETAPFLKKAGCTFINLEQDLNIPGLRTWKSSHRPLTFLKKYTVTLQNPL